MTDPLKQLSDLGVSVWLDDLSRERLESGSLADLVERKHVVGITSNPTIFAKALSDADDYNEQVRECAARQLSVDETVRLVTTYDVRWACDVMKPAYDATNGQDGRVSIEVDPRLAHQTDATLAEAKSLWWMVDRPNVMIKIPATEAALPAITAATADGICVNITLIFSLDRYRTVMEAYATGLEQAKGNGHDLGSIRSVASFFVSRVDTEVDKRLDKIGTPEAGELKAKAAIANARLAYQEYEKFIATDRWKALESAGANRQRPLWASTSVKDPSLPDTMYVVELVAPETVNTMPEGTIEATADHGEITGDTVTSNYAEALAVIDRLGELGISYDDVVQVLEDEGISKFEASWKDLVASVHKELDKHADQTEQSGEETGKDRG
jgi:transaldolase